MQSDPVQSSVVARNALGGLHLGGEEKKGKDLLKDCHPLFPGSGWGGEGMCIFPLLRDLSLSPQRAHDNVIITRQQGWPARR